MPEYAEIDSELLLLAAEAGDMGRKEIVARIQDMKPSERRLLRAAITTLDECFDEATLDLHLKRK